jgi:hypothetical protein
MIWLNMVHVIPRVSPCDGVCEGCVLKKHHPQKFEKGKAQREKSQLEIVFRDLNMMHHPSLAGARHILTFNDDFSKHTRVHFLKNMHMVLERFIDFKALAKKQCGQPMKCLRFNGEGEYVSHTFEGHLSQNGISWQWTMPYTLE